MRWGYFTSNSLVLSRNDFEAPTVRNNIEMTKQSSCALLAIVTKLCIYHVGGLFSQFRRIMQVVPTSWSNLSVARLLVWAQMAAAVPALLVGNC